MTMFNQEGQTVSGNQYNSLSHRPSPADTNLALLRALKALLDDAERRVMGFPPSIERWYVVRDTARAAVEDAEKLGGSC